jgi:hypothetical protein
MDTKVITGKCRISYAYLVEPRPGQNPDDKPKYGCLLLIPKSDKDTMRKLRAAQAAAAALGESGKFNGKKLKGAAGTGASWDTIHDGDETDDPDQEGHWLLNVSAVNKPGIVDRNLQPILDSTEIYSGMYARVSVNAFPYNYQGKIGVTFGLNHVQKLADGDFMGGRSRAEDDFDELDDEDEGLL